MRPKSGGVRRWAIVLLFIGLALGSASISAQDTGGDTAQADVTQELDAALREIESTLELVNSIDARYSESTGLMREVQKTRLVRAQMKLLEEGLAFAATVVDLQQQGTVPDNYLQRAASLLEAQAERAQWVYDFVRSNIQLPAADASAAEQAAANSKAFDQLETLNRSYEILIENLKLSQALGLDVAARETEIRQALSERAAIGSAMLELAISELVARRAGAEVAPDDAEVAARLQVARRYVSRIAENQAPIMAMMESMAMDVSAYREQMLIATGQITTDIFDVGVFTNLLLGWSETLTTAAIEEGPGIVFNLLLFILIVFVFYKLGSLAQRLTETAIDNAELNISQLLRRMLLLMVRNTILFVGVLIALSQVGISLGPLLAGLGLAGFIIGFALQDTLSNFASGMLILIYRPFDVDDYVEAGGVSGLVSNMSLVNTTIMTFDNQTIIVPNNKIWGDVIKNVTAQELRRIDFIFGISYSDDIPKTEKVLQDILDKNESVLSDPEPKIRVHELGDSSVNFVVRPWVRSEDYWETYWQITREVKLRFDEEGISIPFPQRDVHLYSAETNGG